MRNTLMALVLTGCVGGALALAFLPRSVEMVRGREYSSSTTHVSSALLQIPESESLPVGATSSKPAGKFSREPDFPKQKPLANPPSVVKGIYMTSWVAGVDTRVSRLIEMMHRHGLNAVVLDVKDYSGYVAYDTDVPDVQASGAERDLRVARPNALVKKFHDAGIYVIARISVFQDSILAAARPEWALKRTEDGALWSDQKGLMWMDPASEDAWKYNVLVAKDVVERGFDEVNFDYIRFPSDGQLMSIEYPVWDEKTPRAEVMKKFFSHLRAHLPTARISADLFGLTTIDTTDLGIGQIIEDTYGSFDAVAPMVYPSHFATGSFGYKNPARYPYEVVRYSMESALKRLKRYAAGAVSSSSPQSSMLNPLPPTKLRPWLQVFDMGATYDAEMVLKQIKAVEDVLQADPAHDGGYLLWDPKNTYTPLAGLGVL